MRIIDKTPFQDAQGNINVIARGQGTLKFGPNWYPELEAQKIVITQLDRLLDKGFVLIRNFTLPESTIVIPIILLGPGSLTVLFATPVKGHFEAKGSDWNLLRDGNSTPASRNLIDLLSKLTRAFNKYLQLNNIVIPFQPEPVLVATDPGTIVESVRPALKVVRSDAVKQLANSLNSTNAVLRAEQVMFLADQIVDPKLSSPQEKNADPPPAVQVERPLSRAQAIYKAAEEPAPAVTMQSLPKPQAGEQNAQPARTKRRGISGGQIVLLAALGILECCVIGAGAYFLFFSS